MTTPQDILNWLSSKNTNGQPISVAQLTEFAIEMQAKLAQLPLKVPGQTVDAVTLFYNGKVGPETTSLDAWRVAESIGRNGWGKVVTIGKQAIKTHCEFIRKYNQDNPD